MEEYNPWDSRARERIHKCTIHLFLSMIETDESNAYVTALPGMLINSRGLLV